LPDLFIIDGGRGQVQAVYQVHQKAGLKLPIFGIAKRMEWLYPPEGEVIKLPKRNMGLRLIQKIRDESHRFAITYHRKLRAKSFLPKKS
jgi:excinuclease ABC subunit C